MAQKDSSDNAYGPEHTPVDLGYDTPNIWTKGLPDQGAWDEAQASSQSPLARRNGNADPKP